jgi:hypothetical protein
MLGQALRQFILGNNYALARLARELLPVAARRIGIDPPRLQRSFRGIRALKDGAVNAHIRLEAGGRFHISVNTGFIAFVLSMLHLFCSRVAPESQRGHDPLGAPPPDLARLARTVIHRYLGLPGWFGGSVSSIKLNPLQLSLLAEVFQDVQRYAIAHELGHLVARTSARRDGVLRARCAEHADRAFSELIDAAAVQDQPGFDAFARSVKESWTDELEADRLGLEMVMELHGLAERSSIACVAVLMYLVVGYTADVYREEVLNQRCPFSPTHPPSVLRLGALYEDVIERHSADLHEGFYRQFLSWTQYVVSSAKAERSART